VDRVGGVGPGNAARFSQAGLTVAGTGYVAGPAAASAAPKAARQTAVAERDGMAPAKKATPQ
jgi:competence protein ComEA